MAGQGLAWVGTGDEGGSSVVGGEGSGPLLDGSAHGWEFANFADELVTKGVLEHLSHDSALLHPIKDAHSL